LQILAAIAVGPAGATAAPQSGPPKPPPAHADDLVPQQVGSNATGLRYSHSTPNAIVGPIILVILAWRLLVAVALHVETGRTVWGVVRDTGNSCCAATICCSNNGEGASGAHTAIPRHATVSMKCQPNPVNAGRPNLDCWVSVNGHRQQQHGDFIDAKAQRGEIDMLPPLNRDGSHRSTTRMCPRCVLFGG